ncbi:FMN-linked oxidoreductase [Dacryopinax primogenitus]|uniref:FMN-linked oxidoreductase n=1 Tax=Dacryopinax primogenitus (strain DJM 731) TaxID=1858805 RepID=M5G135_DACPD|nr:FMN-linked oxidoreductase [Dacryopinax primogenitus]EJU01875.1 FMN-linked oxidoreductase [Dacryopinax primogenitus]
MGEAVNSSSIADSVLFTPIQLGPVTLSHRIAMGPLTRHRNYADHTPSEIALTMYTQRASYPGTLIVTEGNFFAKQSGGYRHVPGIYNETQIEAWKKITDAVRSKGCYMALQLWCLGRAALEEVAKDEGFEIFSPGDIPLPGQSKPHMLTIPEIKAWIEIYTQAAKNAVAAGFDFVEVHAANGYFIDQFLHEVSNNRTDEYGGSIENRCRLALEAAQAVVDIVGQERTGLRISPWGEFLDPFCSLYYDDRMRMDDPIPTFSYLVRQFKERFPNFAYLHVTEPRVEGDVDRQDRPKESNDFLREIWRPNVYLTAGGYTEDVRDVIPRMGDVLVYGRYFISNPDLPHRLKKGIPFTKYNRATFYLHGPDKTEGYTDYPTAEEQAHLVAKQ